MLIGSNHPDDLSGIPLTPPCPYRSFFGVWRGLPVLIHTESELSTMVISATLGKED